MRNVNIFLFDCPITRN